MIILSLILATLLRQSGSISFGNSVAGELMLFFRFENMTM